VIDSIEQGKIEARIAGLITNKSDIKALERAKKHQIPTAVLKPSSYSDKKGYEQALLDTLEQWQPSLIVLAGYLYKIPSAIIQAYPQRIINIHPSLLPDFGGKGMYGIHVHRAAIKQGVSESGCTVHIVTEKYDQGPILGQKKVAVHKTDTPQELARRILTQEHLLLPQVIGSFIKNLNSNS